MYSARRNKYYVTPKYRAGQNIFDQTKSGYARTNVLGQEDLFPREGFPPQSRDVSKRIHNYKDSEDSPFNIPKTEKMITPSHVDEVINKNRKKMMETERNCTRTAAKALAMPTPGELRVVNSEVAKQAIRKDLDEQVKLKEKIRIAQMKDDDRWVNLENEQISNTISINDNIAFKKTRTQQNLAKEYRHQLDLHRQAKEEEKRQDQIEALKIREELRRQDLEERIRQEKLRQIAHERKKEFQKRNDELLQRRQKKIEDDIEAEKILAKQKAEVDQRMEERAEFERKRRENKNMIRNRLIENQSKRLAETMARQQRTQNNAESEVAKREEAERKRQIQRRKEMAQERNRDWLKSQRERDLKITNKVEEPDFYGDDDEELRRAEAYYRRKKLLALQSDQKKQILERKKKEDDEDYIRKHYYDNQYFLKDEEW